MEIDIDNPNVDNALATITDRISIKPHIALVLGSGLGDFADELSDSISIPTSTIPNYPASTVQGHEGKLVFGHITKGQGKSLPLLVFKGRVHYYELGDLNTALFPIRVAKELGARYLIVTNAAGGLNRKFVAGDLMLIRDYLDLSFIRNPVSITEQVKSAQPQFRKPLTSLINLFDASLQALIKQSAERLHVKLQEGVYCWLKGPSYETKSEIQMLSRLGVDAVGMSTVPEIILAHQLNMKVAGISLISNLAAGLGGEKLSHQEVTETANRVKEQFSELLKEVLLNIRE